MNADALIGQHLVRLMALSDFDAKLVGAYRQLSDDDRAKLDRHEGHLQTHLRSVGVDGASPALRRLACLVPGAMRGLADWLSCLDQNRGGFSERRLAEAMGWLERIAPSVNAARRIPLSRMAQLAAVAPEAAAQPLRDLSDDDLVMWLASLGPLASGDRRHALSQAAAYDDLSARDVDAVIQFALELLDGSSPDAENASADVLLPLALLRPQGLAGAHHALLDRAIRYPGELFRNADSLTATRLLGELESDATNRNHTLTALAWIGNEVVRSRFAEWRADPPSWRSSLYVPPHEYAQEAGWTLDDAGSRRDLYLSSCYALVAPGEQAGAENPVQTLTARADRCEWCDGQLLNLFDLDLRDARLSVLGLAGGLDPPSWTSYERRIRCPG